MGGSTLFGYSTNGSQLTSITGPTGATMQFGYEGGRVTSISQSNTTAGSPGTSVTRLAYPSTTQTLVARPNTNQSSPVASVPRTAYTIASSSRLVTAVTDEMGRRQAASYTANGDVATATSGTGATAGTTNATYGANSGRSLTSLAGPGGATTSAAYANTAAATRYLPSSMTDSAGNASTYTYTGAGNALTASNALAATATLTYNANGTVATALAPGNGSNKTIYGYTSGQLTSVTPVTGSTLGARAFTYDALGRLRTATDGRGITLTYSYDKLDRLLTTAFSDGTPTVTNTYTHTGLPSTRIDGNGTTTYGYDQLGRLISRVNTFAGGTITYGYDRSSNLTTVTDTRGTTVNSFDNSGVPTKIVYVHNAGTQTLMFANDNRGRRTDTWLESNADHTLWTAHTRQDYDTSGRVSRSIGETRASGNGAITVMFDTTYCFNAGSAAPTCSTAPGTDRSKLQWQRDNLNGQVTAYTYDGAGRLLKATQTGGTAPRTYTYTYDARGNRLTSTVTGGSSSSQSLSFNAANQVTTAGYTFDGTGNLTADPSGTYAYNGAEQMTQVTNGNGDGSHTYKYAGTSQVEVLQQQSAGSTYQLVYGRTNQVGQPVIEQVKEDGTTAYIENDPVTGQPLMLRSSSGIQTLYVYDGLGSPVAMLTDYASTAYAYTFDPYGVAVLAAGGGGSGALQNPFLFKGGTQDRATGWVHYGNRWYNPTIGRWTQQDTLDAPLDPANANRYAYAGCDPINNADPTGRLTTACFNALSTLLASGVLTGLSLAGVVASAAAGNPLLAGAIGATLTAFGIARTVYYAAAVVRAC